MTGPTNASVAETSSVTQPAVQPPAALIFVGPKRVPAKSHATLKTFLLAAAGLGVAGVLSMLCPPVRARVSLVRTSLAIALFRGGFVKKIKTSGAVFLASLQGKLVQWRNPKSDENPEAEVHRPTPVELLLKKIGAPQAKDVRTSNGAHAQKTAEAPLTPKPEANKATESVPAKEGSAIVPAPGNGSVPAPVGSTQALSGSTPNPETKPPPAESPQVAIEPMRVVVGPTPPPLPPAATTPAEKLGEPVNA